MSIRYHLLLVAGITTTVVFLASFFLESFLLNRSLESAGAASQSLYYKIQDKRREYLEEFVQEALVERLSKINALLGTISQYKPLAEWFSPSKEHAQKGTWSNAANLIQQDDWIEFIQNTTENDLLSLVIPKKGPFSPIRAIPIEKGIAWVYVLKEQEGIMPFIGIQVMNKPDITGRDGDGGGTLGILPTVYALYSLEHLRAIDFSEEGDIPYIPTPYANGVEVDEQSFLEFLSRAMDLVHKPDFQIPAWKGQEIETKNSTHETSFQKEVEESLQRRIAYSKELFVIWQAAVLREYGAFGVKKFNWPDAMSFGVLDDEGEVFFLEEVMGFSSPLFDDETFYAKNLPKGPESLASSGTQVISGPGKGQAFLVNTAALFEEEERGNRRSLLTIGAGLSAILDDLVTMTRGFGIILSEGKVLVSQAPEGGEAFSSEVIESLLPTLVAKQGGDICIKGEGYHFVFMNPDPSLDLHFLLLHPKSDVFDFSYNFQLFQNQMGELIDQLDLDRRSLEGIGIFILWLLLLRLSKKITRPIVTLAKALPHVKRGEWDQIHLPVTSFKEGNEIALLYDSFHDMVNSLKEKEKVTGILNKVVSPEIAREILKGTVSLGGEDRVVTMLFVDIRGFTKLTQNMPPHEVIGLLNSCMTKLTALVEKHGGVIDKFLGDGLMALYGAPVPSDTHANAGICSGLEMIAAIEEWNQSRERKGRTPITIGVGVHAGPVCVGNMGAQDRLNYTVIGSHVNLASRLCSAAAPGALLITEDTLKEPGITDCFIFEDKGMMSFKGFDEPKHVFQVVAKKE